MRAVLDANVLVSALLSRAGAPARIVERWLAGELEVILSERLLAELERTLAYPKLRSRITATEAARLVAFLRESALVASDPGDLPRRSPDPEDDYLLALPEAERALLVSGDSHLLGLAEHLPVESPRGFLELLDRRSGRL